jgi:hypothetical protein
MSDAAPTPGLKAQKQSSPRYPFISLSKAIERADQFRLAAGSNAAFVTDARTAWGYGAKSSGGDQTTAALSYYGLLEDTGSGPARKLKLSDSALRYFKDERPEVRAQLLAEFARAPKAMGKLWDLWKHEPPSDSIARSILKVDLHYSDYAAGEVLGIYKENLRYIPSGKSDKPPEVGSLKSNDGGTKEQELPLYPAKVGDYVQWTSGGVDQFKAPMRVSWVSEDQSFLRVHGNLTGVPMSEVTVTEAPKAPLTNIGTHAPQSGRDSDRGELNVLLTGNRLQITADVDRAGLVRLKEILTRYEGILELMEPTAKN